MIMKMHDNQEELAEMVSEELNLFMGFKTEVFKDGFSYKLKLDTVAGIMIFSLTSKNVMENVYRFIMIYGSKLHYWGLENKNIESRKELLKLPKNQIINR